jgi:hypothetical protein
MLIFPNVKFVIFYLILGNWDICVKWKILVINEMKFCRSWKFRTEKNFIEYHKHLLKLWMKFAQLLAIFHGMTES